MIQQILETRYWFQPGVLTPLEGGLIHQVWGTESGHVVKLYRGTGWMRQVVKPALEIQSFAALCGLPVPHVRRTPDGAWVVPAGDGWLAVTEYVPGRQIDGTAFDEPLAAEAGRVLARLHTMLAGLPTGEKQPFIPAADQIRERCERLLEAGAGDPLAVEAAEYRLAALAEYPVNPAHYQEMTWQVAHGDYYPGNLIFGPAGQVRGVLDWDFAGAQWRELEVARAAVECALTAGGGIARGRLAAFLDAYSQESPISPRQRKWMFRLWFNYLLWSLYPVSNRFTPGEELPREWEKLARRRHRMLTLVGSHLDALEG